MELIPGEVEFFHLVTKGGRHWVVARPIGEERWFQLRKDFDNEAGASEHLTILQGEYDLANALEKALPELIKEYPRGIRVKVIAERFRTTDDKARQACIALEQRQVAHFGYPGDRGYHVLWPMNYELPGPFLTERQQRVYDALNLMSDENSRVQVGQRVLADWCNLNQASVFQILETLQKKHRIRKVKNATNNSAAIYLVLDSDD